MGLGISAIKLNLELWQRGFFKNIKSVIDMGAQELHVTETDFEKLVQITGISNYRRENFPNLENWPRSPRCSSRHFYEMLGATEYSCIDLGGGRGVIPLDLNFPLEDPSLYGQYDLVTDYGTNEHVFNTGEAYRTMHRLCKKDGLLVIEQVVYRGNGYFCYDPSFFEGIAAANNYRIIFSSYHLGLKTKTQSGGDNQFHIPLSDELLDTFDWTKTRSVGICYVIQKETSNDFCYPYEGRYLTRAQGHYGYKLQFLSEPPSRAYIPQYTPEAIPTKVLLQMLFERAKKKIKI